MPVMPPPPPPVRATTLRPGTLVLGRYRVGTIEGRGGSAEIIGARDERSGRDVVVKVPSAECQGRPAERERFRREIAFLRTLVHPHIVPILDAGEEQGLDLAVLARLAGGTLADRRARLGVGEPPRGPVADLPAWLPAIASALDFIHAARVFHRDLKPANILFDGEGTACLADFGLAKALSGETSLTPGGCSVGTPEYLSPEQIRDERPTAAADQYALGTIVYEWLAGCTPFPAASLGKLLWMKASDETPSLAVAVPAAAPALVAAVDRATRREAEARFPSCTAFATAVLAAR